METVVDPDAKQLSSCSPIDRPYVVHCVGAEKEADFVLVFAVRLLFILFILLFILSN